MEYAENAEVTDEELSMLLGRNKVKRKLKDRFLVFLLGEHAEKDEENS